MLYSSRVQRGPTDLRNFDPIITCVPATLDELITTTTEEHTHIDGFDYVATNASEQSTSVKSSDTTGSRDEKNGVNGVPGGWGEDTSEEEIVEAGTPTKTDSLKQSVIEDT